MSRRYRKRRQERILNTEHIAVSAPRGLTHPLPHNPEVRVRPLFDKQSLDRHNFGLDRMSAEEFRNLRRIDNEKIVQDLRRLHIEHDIANNRSPSYARYDYKRINVGRDEKVFLPSDHPICKEREERREVLFARRKAGKGGQNPPIIRLTVKCEKRRR